MIHFDLVADLARDRLAEMHAAADHARLLSDLRPRRGWRGLLRRHQPRGAPDLRLVPGTRPSTPRARAAGDRVA
jgi:hypothetical protein